jgi:hypothetical protein
MTNHRAAIAATIAALALAGCAAPPSSSPASPAAPVATATQGVTAKPSATAPAAAAFGTPKRVTNAAGNTLTITPVEAWWLAGNIQSRYIPHAASSGLSPAENGRFLIIEMRVEAVSGTAYFPAPIIGGPAIFTHHRLFTDAGDSASDNVVWGTCLPYVDSNIALHPGAWMLNSETYDVPPGPAQLAWLVGTQGASTATWQVPAHSTGPLPANVRAALRTGNGC